MKDELQGGVRAPWRRLCLAMNAPNSAMRMNAIDSDHSHAKSWPWHTMKKASWEASPFSFGVSMWRRHQPEPALLVAAGPVDGGDHIRLRTDAGRAHVTDRHRGPFSLSEVLAPEGRRQDGERILRIAFEQVERPRRQIVGLAIERLLRHGDGAGGFRLSPSCAERRLEDRSGRSRRPPCRSRTGIGHPARSPRPSIAGGSGS